MIFFSILKAGDFIYPGHLKSRMAVDIKATLEGTTFFDLVKAKKMEMQLASDYTTFLADNRHEAEEQVKTILSEYK